MRFIYSRTFFWFSVALVAVFILVFLQSFNKIESIKKGFLVLPKPAVYLGKKVSRPAKDFFSTILTLKQILKENKLLRDRNSELMLSLANLENQAAENEILRQELNFKKSTKMEMIGCSIIAGNTFDANDSITLDCGLEAGVKEGQAVLSSGFLAGKVVFSSARTSTAVLVSSSDFLTDAKIAKTGIAGVVKGSFGSGIMADQFPQEANINPGDLVVTAGINDKIQKNLVIGEIGEVYSLPNDLFKKATLLSPIKFRDLSFVFIVK